MESRIYFQKYLLALYKEREALLEFKEDVDTGYKPRTIKNASADATLAFAIDFATSGEILTKESVITQGKKYIPIDVNDADSIFNYQHVIDELNNCGAKTLNIAGNGLYTMKNRYRQIEIDMIVYDVLSNVLPNLENKIELIRSGGQSGFDEAGIKAAIKLGIKALVLAPKGWIYRDADGVDIQDENKFKNRFKQIY